jgi:hypothetical protein
MAICSSAINAFALSGLGLVDGAELANRGVS